MGVANSSMKKRTRIQWLALIGAIGTVFYFFHIIFGKLSYPDYSAMAQAVSDLTATTAPSREVASYFTGLYASFSIAAFVLLCVFYQDRMNKAFRIGIYLFTAMHLTSAIGFVPLSEPGYEGALQDVIHVVATAFVVLFSIASMIFIAVGCIKSKTYKAFGIFTITVLGIMALGSIGTGIVPIEYFGIPQRVSVYSVVIYSAVLSLFTFIIDYKYTNPT